VLSALIRTQLENDILQAGRLSSGPVNSANLSSRSDSSGIKDEIADLSPEDSGSGPVGISAEVWVCVNQGAAIESRRRLQDWQ
jgi:hypothetical protein